MRRFFASIFLLGATGCSTELTPQAQLVRQIPAEIKTNCKFLGPVTGMELFGWSTAHDAESALNKVRNEVAKRGGNAFVLTKMTSDYDGASALADAYLCPK
ncbi:MAG TPA: DUF4156 domain-containing protein [Rhodobacteraceae bacterium]|nr:DUF4156 domain-containing protein [Paracoccaceae bacterium]